MGRDTKLIPCEECSGRMGEKQVGRDLQELRWNKQYQGCGLEWAIKSDLEPVTMLVEHERPERLGTSSAWHRSVMARDEWRHYPSMDRLE